MLKIFVNDVFSTYLSPYFFKLVLVLFWASKSILDVLKMFLKYFLGTHFH